MNDSLKDVSISTLVSVLLILIVILGAGLGYELALNHSTTTVTQRVTTTSYITETTAPPSIVSMELGNVDVGSYGAFPPRWIASDPNLESLYLSGGSSIMTVDAKNLIIMDNYSLPGSSSYIYGIDSKTNILYVLYTSCGGSSSAACNQTNDKTYAGEVNGTSGVLMRYYPIQNYAFYAAFAVNPETDTLYESELCPNPNSGNIFDEYLSDCGYLVVVNADTGAQLSNISLGQEPWSTAVNPSTNIIYTTNGSVLLIINGTTDSIQSRIALRFSDSTPIIRVDATSNTVFEFGANETSTPTSDVFLAALNGSSGHILYISDIGSACRIDSSYFYLNSITDQIYIDAGLSPNNLVYINASTGRITNIVSIPSQYYVESSTFNQELGETFVLLNGSIVALPSHLNQYYDNASLFALAFCPGLIG